MSTVKAALGGGIPLVDLDEVPSVPCCLVFQLPDKLTLSHIRDGFRKAMVLDHVFDCQTLHAYCLVLTNNASRELVLVVTASITDTCMDTSNLATGMVFILGAFLLPGMSPLSLGQLLFILGKELGIANGLTSGKDHHRLETQVKPNFLLHRRQVGDLLFYQQRNEIAVCGVLAYRHRRRLAPIRQRTRPVDIKRHIHPGKGQLLAIPLESRSRIFGCLRSLFFLECRILSQSLKEVPECLVQMSQGLLGRDTGDFIEPGKFLFQCGKTGRGFVIPDTLVLLIVSIRTQAQGPIIDETSTAKGLSKAVFLLIRWVKSVLVGSFLFHASHCITYRVKHQPFLRLRALSFLPQPEGMRVSRKVF